MDRGMDEQVGGGWTDGGLATSLGLALRLGKKWLEEEISNLEMKSVRGKVKRQEGGLAPCPAQAFLTSIRAAYQGPENPTVCSSWPWLWLPLPASQGGADGSEVGPWDPLDCQGQRKVPWGSGLVELCCARVVNRLQVLKKKPGLEFSLLTNETANKDPL